MTEQLEVPGTERPTIPDVEQAADALRAAERTASLAADMKATKQEALLFALVAAGVKTYKYTDAHGSKWTIVASSRTSVKIKRGHE